jgi:hypothetical protein
MRTIASLLVACIGGTVAAFAGAAADGVMTWIVYILVGFVFVPLGVAVGPPRSGGWRRLRNRDGRSSA